MAKQNELKCPDCGSMEYYEHHTIEGSDRDGRRGMLVTWIICANCECDLLSDLPF